ncbi:hypothetical protein BT63DRAFT_438048 [Microthyrium microscopicum]|uniref:Mid2 domain-containing protein n=1 Tax=Microthyrium microscopicum TaxID=703497 RepID=A0A6A6UKA8_9PEZI|nr:hypothetical protein BT63DRAFT_438048 [Microthyrium microscopicum]
MNLRYAFSALVIGVLFLAISVVSQETPVTVITPDSDNNFFIEPPANVSSHQDYSSNPVYTLGQTLDIQWITDIPSLQFDLYQGNQTVNVTVQHLFGPTTISPGATNGMSVGFQNGTSTWSVALTPSFVLNAKIGNVFFMAALNAGNQVGFASRYFNITDPNATSSSVTSAPTTSKTSDTTPTNTPQPSLKPSIGGGSIAGIVVAALGGTFACLVVARLLWRKRRLGRQPPEKEPEDATWQKTELDAKSKDPYELNGTAVAELPGTSQLAELHSEPAELPAEEGQRLARRSEESAASIT